MMTQDPFGLSSNHLSGYGWGQRSEVRSNSRFIRSRMSPVEVGLVVHPQVVVEMALLRVTGGPRFAGSDPGPARPDFGAEVLRLTAGDEVRRSDVRGRGRFRRRPGSFIREGRRRPKMR